MRALIAVAALVCAVAVSAPYDQTQHAALGHVPVYASGQQVALVILQRGRFACDEGWARAVLVAANGAAWIGCWRRVEGALTVRFEDGEEMTAPAPRGGT